MQQQIGVVDALEFDFTFGKSRRLLAQIRYPRLNDNALRARVQHGYLCQGNTHLPAPRQRIVLHLRLRSHPQPVLIY